MKHCLQRLITSSQSKQNQGVNEDIKSKSKFRLIKTGYPNIIHGWDFLSSNLMNNFIAYTFSKQSYESDHCDRLFHAYLKSLIVLFIHLFLDLMIDRQIDSGFRIN